MKAALFVFMLMVPVHEFYSWQCCSGKDCRPVSCDEITPVEGGWMWRDLKFKREMLQEAPDGNCHVCIAKDALSVAANGPRCIYLPPRT